MVSTVGPRVTTQRRLTPREVDVLRLAREGLCYTVIADRLSITVGTLKTHFRHIYTKLDVPSWANPMAWLAVNADRITEELGDSSNSSLTP